MMWIFVLLCACAHAAEPPRAVVKRASLPDQLREQLPRRGAVVWLAGGEGSLFVMFDRDAKTIRTLTVQPAAPDATTSRKLTSAQVKRFWSLADAAWREPRGPTHEPHLDYNEELAIGDGDDAFHLEGNGSIEQPAAAALIKALVDASK